MFKKAFLLALLPFLGWAQTPTWSDDIACILYSHCTSCHRPGNIAPFSLTSFAEAAPLANQLANAVQARRMPPWPPDEAYRRLAHERILSNAEIQAIVDWASAGAPEGNAALAPPPPVFSSNFEIVNPDLVLQIPAYTIPAITSDLYRCFVLPTTLPGGQKLTELEVVPGNRAVVHHVLVYQDNSSIPAQLDAADPGPGYTSFGGIGSPGADLVGGWVPGMSKWTAPPGMGMTLDANTNMVLQIHYPVGSTGQLDSTSIRMKYSSATLRPLVLAPVLEHYATLTNGPLVIPANQVKTFHNQFTVNNTATITLIGPHAHLLCTSMKSFAIKPSGDTIPLIDIPEWDFHWQGFYQFQKPIILPAGTVLHGYATYDNTSANPSNPNSPPQTVSLGEATDEEMMLFYFGYTYTLPGDENIVIDTASHPDHYLNCGFAVGVEEHAPQHNLARVYPNPAQSVITLQNGESTITWRLLDLHGKELQRGTLAPLENQTLLVDALPTGIYLVEFHSDVSVQRERIIVN